MPIGVEIHESKIEIIKSLVKKTGVRVEIKESPFDPQKIIVEPRGNKSKVENFLNEFWKNFGKIN